MKGMKLMQGKMLFAGMIALFMAATLIADDEKTGLYPDRWFYCSRQVRANEDVDYYADLLDKAKRGGYNGLLFAGNLENAFTWPEERKALFSKVKKLCDDSGIELIPLVWSPGYGSFCGLDRDLYEVEPVKKVPYRREGKKLVFSSQLSKLENLDFEDYDEKRNTFAQWYSDQPGVISFVEKETVHGGKACLRMEPSLSKSPHGHARLSRTIDVTPGRRYSFTVTLRTSMLRGKRRCLRLQAYTDKGNGIGAKSVRLPADGTIGWTTETLTFPSGDATRVTLYFGTWGGEGGTFWVDDVSVSESGLRELSLRSDCKPIVKSAKTGRVYKAGFDYLLPKRNLDATRDIEFEIPSGSKIAKGEELLIDGYVISRYGPKMQSSTCMSHPHFYELLEKSAAEVQRLAKPKKWFLSVDEVRNGNACPLCTARKTDMAHILGDCVTRMHKIVRRQNPDAMIYAWADMFSPYHNAVDDYCGCRGTLKGVWNLLPKDIVMNCWSWQLAKQDMKFLSAKGFKVQAAGYYDSRRVDEDIEWIDLLNSIPGATGWIYTSWEEDFEFLEEYGKLRNKRSRRK